MTCGCIDSNLKKFNLFTSETSLLRTRFFFNVIKPLRDIPKNGCEGDLLKTCVFPIDVSSIFRLHQ